MKIHKLSYRLVRSFVLFVGVLGAITLFTNVSYTGGQTLASAAECELSYDPDTKTLTVGPGDLSTNFKNQENVRLAETIVFVSADTSLDKVVAPQNSAELFWRWLTNLKRFQGMKNLDTSNVTSMNRMFSECHGLTELDVSGFNTSKVTDMSYMFSGCGITQVDVSGFNTSEVTTMNEMFRSCNLLTQVDVSGFNTSKVTNMSGMFSGCNYLTQVDVSGFNTSKVTDMSGMFSGCVRLTQLDVSGFDTAEVTNMAGMFQCDGLTQLDVSGFDTAKVTNMSGMFHCNGLTQLDVSGFDTAEVTNMSAMFDCNGLTQLDVSGFDTSKVTNMSFMFYPCSSLTQLNLRGFNTSKVKDMSHMFSGCSSLTSVDVSGFNTSEATNMSNMFNGCQLLTQLDVSEFDTSKVTNMSAMFSGCSSLNQLDLRGFNTTKVTGVGSMAGMFSNTNALWKLTLGPDFVLFPPIVLPLPTPITVTNGLLDPVVGTPFQQNYRNDTVSSPKWLNVQTGDEYTAAQIPTAHVQGVTDIYIWQGHENTTVEYVVQPTYTITIPAAITIPSATVAGTGNVTLSAYPKVPYENRFIHISATSESTNSWHLTTTGDATGAEYDFSAEGEVDLKAGSDLVLEADGEAPAKTKIVSASLTDNTQKFKYAGAYKDIVTFTIETAAS